MFVPTFDNDVSVLVNHSFDLTEIVRFDALLLKNLNTSGIFLSFYCLSATKLGIIFDTTNVSAKYLL